MSTQLTFGRRPPTLDPTANVDDRLKACADFLAFTSEARKSFTAKAKVSNFFDRGCVHAYAEEDGTSVIYDPNISKGVIRVPVIPNIVSRTVATMMGERVFFGPAANGSGFEDALRRDAVSLIISEYDRCNSVHLNNIALARSLINVGKAYKRLYKEETYVPVCLRPENFDAWAMRKIESERRINPEYQLRVKQDQVVPMPDGSIRIPVLLPVVKEANMTGFQVVAETGADSLDNASVFAFFELRTIDQLAIEFADTGFDFDKLKPLGIQDREVPFETGEVNATRYISGGGQQTGDSFSGAFGMVRYYDFWKKLPHGSYYHMGVIRDGMKFHFLFDEYADFHPYVEYNCIHRPNEFWDDGLTYRATDPARAYAFSLTDLQRNFRHSMKDVIIADASLEGKITNEFGSVVFANPRGGAPLFRLPMPQGAHQHLMELANVFRQNIEDCFGVSDVTMGRMKSHTSVTATEIARQTDVGPIGTIRTQFDESERKKYEKIVRLYGSMMDEPRYIAATGSESRGTIISRAVTSEDISGVYGIEIKDTVPMPKTLPERLSLVDSFARLGLVQSAGEIREYLKIQDGYIPEPVIERMEEDRARIECLWLQTGEAAHSGMILEVDPQTGREEARPGPVVYQGPNMNLYGELLLRPTDIHEIHIRIIDEFIRGNQFPREALPSVYAHREEHEKAIAEAQQQQQAAALEMKAEDSKASQAGQMELAKFQQQVQEGTAPITATLSPSDGGQISGAIRRGEL